MKIASFLFFFLTWGWIVQAQIVNIEDRRVAPPDSAAWVGNADLRLSLRENGSQILAFGGSFQVEHIGQKQIWLGFGSYDQTNINGNRFVNEGVAHLRYNRQLGPWLVWEAFGQAQTNERLRIQFRGLLGTGPRIRLLEQDKQKAFLGALYMYEYDEVLDSTLTFRDHRLSAYISFQLQPFEHLIVSSTNYYQPILPAFNQVRLSSKTSLQFLLNKRLSFITSFDISFDRRLKEEVPDVVGTVYGFTNAFRVSF